MSWPDKGMLRFTASWKAFGLSFLLERRSLYVILPFLLVVIDWSHRHTVDERVAMDNVD